MRCKTLSYIPPAKFQKSMRNSIVSQVPWFVVHTKHDVVKIWQQNSRHLALIDTGTCNGVRYMRKVAYFILVQIVTQLAEGKSTYATDT